MLPKGDIEHRLRGQKTAVAVNETKYAEIIKMAAARVNLGSSTRRFRTGQKIHIRRVLKCLDSMMLKTRPRLNPRGHHIYEFGVEITTLTCSIHIWAMTIRCLCTFIHIYSMPCSNFTTKAIAI